MIQHNRGGTYSADGKLERLVGPEGATLYLLSVPDGKRTDLQVGPPCTTPCTGHEAWIGNTKEMLLTVSQAVNTPRRRATCWAYLTPDLKWVIFNSNRSGFPRIYAAAFRRGRSRSC